MGWFVLVKHLIPFQIIKEEGYAELTLMSVL